MFFTHLKSAHALCPAGWRKSFIFTNHTQRSGSPEHSAPEIGVVLDVVRAVVRTVVRTVRNGVRVLEHPTRRRKNDQRSTHATEYGDTTHSRVTSGIFLLGRDTRPKPHPFDRQQNALHFIGYTDTSICGSPEHSAPENGVAPDAERAVARTVARTVRNGARVLEHPTRRRN